jgi:hypothetical protein
MLGWVINGATEGSVPAIEWIAVKSSAARSSSVGRRPDSRSASVVLRPPGGPVRKSWCPPGTSTVRRPAVCPISSLRSGLGLGGGTGPRARGSSFCPPFRCLTRPPRGTVSSRHERGLVGVGRRNDHLRVPGADGDQDGGQHARIARTDPSSPGSPAGSASARTCAAPGLPR